MRGREKKECYGINYVKSFKYPDGHLSLPKRRTLGGNGRGGSLSLSS